VFVMELCLHLDAISAVKALKKPAGSVNENISRAVLTNILIAIMIVMFMKIIFELTKCIKDNLNLITPNIRRFAT